jgi:poly(hydroxyalkanoate) granule-associated protein
LVAEGATLQKKTQTVAEDKLSDVTSKMSTMAGEVQARAGQHWDKLESIFEERTAKALKRLGVPSAKDVQALAARIDALHGQVAKLSKSGAAKTAPGKTTAAKKSTAVKRTARKSAA